MPMVAYFEERSPAADRRRSVRRALRLGALAGDNAEVAKQCKEFKDQLVKYKAEEEKKKGQ